ncbi:MAG: TIGR00730 family Rossman fold protein [Gammaproteobacteria bacterium]|nr:TIGR00730 family Rossman fold protein [Gammaproteobacteria bacterium]NNJ83973.1 TIGR00730 family Rossman fold protein [Gammaproteobacteria bacterium]
MKNLCIFCGAQRGNNPDFESTLLALAQILIAREITVVYGGGSVGLMGILADYIVQNNGRIIGVIPESLADRELLHHNLTECHIVGSMHLRKQKMHELSDAFVLAPGGFGSIEEFFEALTWTQLGLHEKPCGILDINGYYKHLLLFLEDALETGFLSHQDHRRVLVSSNPEALMSMMEAH